MWRKLPCDIAKHLVILLNNLFAVFEIPVFCYAARVMKGPSHNGSIFERFLPNKQCFPMCSFYET